jgi:hypothetical protein
MAKKTTSYVDKPAAKTATAVPTATQTPADEVVAVLLDLLRRADQQVITPELSGPAQDAVETYKRISLDLRVRDFQSVTSPDPGTTAPAAGV